MIRHIVQVFLCLLVLGATVAISWMLVVNRRTAPKNLSRPPPLLVRVLEVQPGSHEVEIRSQGTVRPRTSSTLIPEVSGRILEVSPAWAEGGYFEEGDLLLRIDPTDHELELVVARARVAQSELRLAQEEQEAAVARSEWEAVGKKTEEPPPLVLREPQLNNARAALEAARAQVRRAEIDLKRTEIRAPFAGRILQKSVDIGQYVTRATAVARIYAIDYAEVRLPIPDLELAYLDLPRRHRGETGEAQGPTVYLTATFAGREQTWKGTVVRTEGEIDPRSRMVHVVARVKAPYGRGEDPDRPHLAVGLFVKARILGRTLQDVYVLERHILRGADRVLICETDKKLLGDLVTFWDLLPEISVLFRKPDRSELSLLCGQLHSREVEVLRTRGNLVIVRQGKRTGASPGKGLLPGDRICVSPLDVFVEGMHVRIAKSSGKEGVSRSGEERAQ